MSELHAPARSRKSAYFWRVYMSVWAFLAAGALGYLGMFAVHPDEAGRATAIFSNPLQSNQESNKSEIGREQLSAQVRTLNETVASLRSDLARMKENRAKPAPDAGSTPHIISVRPVPTRQVANSQAANEASSNLTTSSITPPASTALAADDEAAANTPTPTPDAMTQTEAAPKQEAAPEPQSVKPEIVNATAASPHPALRAKGPNLATSPLRRGKLPPLPRRNGQGSASLLPTGSTLAQNRDQPMLINGQYPTAAPTSVIATGSLPVMPQNEATAAAALKPTATPLSPRQTAAMPFQPQPFGAPKVNQHRPTPAALSLSTATSVTGLKASWLLLTSRYGNIFSGYTPRYVADPATGTYRLLAGPIANRVDADRLCNELRSEDVTCGVADYVGAPL